MRSELKVKIPYLLVSLSWVTLPELKFLMNPRLLSKISPDWILIPPSLRFLHILLSWENSIFYILKYLINIGLENMFNIAESLCQSDFSWICKAYLITYLFYANVEWIESLLYLYCTLSNSSLSSCDPQKESLKIICNRTDKHSDITAFWRWAHFIP